MLIRPQAIQWLRSNYGDVDGAIITSKFYQPDESWTRSIVWFFEFAIDKLKQGDNIHLLCQTAANKSEFHYLKVPTEFLEKELEKLTVRKDNRISLFLSAEPQTLFIDQRSKHKICFKEFLIN